MASLPKECILSIGGQQLLMPVEQAAQAFQLLHGSTPIATRYDASYKDIGWKIAGNVKITLEHADPTIRAKLALGEGE